MRDKGPLGFVGLWERWEREGDRVIKCYAILTTEASEALRPVYDRMLVIRHPDDYELWLDSTAHKLELVSGLTQRRRLSATP